MATPAHSKLLSAQNLEERLFDPVYHSGDRLRDRPTIGRVFTYNHYPERLSQAEREQIERYYLATPERREAEEDRLKRHKEAEAIAMKALNALYDEGSAD